LLGGRLRREQGGERRCDARGNPRGSSDQRRGGDHAGRGRAGGSGRRERGTGPREQREPGQAGRKEEEGHADGRGKLRRRDVREQQQKDLVNALAVRGVGLGLRWDFLDELVERTSEDALAPVDFLEISPENYMGRGGAHPSVLAWLAERYPVVTHGLTMSLGGSDPLDDSYLRDLRATLRSLRTPWHSDHLCVGAVGGRVLHDLLPVPFKHAAVKRIADRMKRAQDAIGVPLAIENVSYYWHPGRAELGESEFLASVCEAAGCGLMLDVNNAYVNCENFGIDPQAWLRAAPLDRVVQIHVAGHEWFVVDERGLGDLAAPRSPGAMIIDTHGAPVPDPVLALLEQVLVRTGPVPIVLERDQNVPALGALLDEVARIRAVAERCAAEATPATR
jgi:uncharacterized protein